MKRSHSVIGIVQARMSSTRLPGKCLLPLGHGCVSALDLVVCRLLSVNTVDAVCVATTDNPCDDIIEMHLDRSLSQRDREFVNVYRGSEQDVLDRTYQAALMMKADIIVDVTSDCPLVCPNMVRDMVKEFRVKSKGSIDYFYLGNAEPRTVPDGLDVQVYSIRALTRLQNLSRGIKREHSGWNMTQCPNKFKCASHIPKAKELRRPEVRVTLDTPQDYKLLQEIIPWNRGVFFSTKDAIAEYDRIKGKGGI